MNVTIFGNGFVVDHLAKSLLSEGNGVTVFSEIKPRIIGANVYNPSSGEATWYNHINFIGGDILSYPSVYYTIKRGDIVVNLLDLRTDDIHKSVGTNILGSANIAQACYENGISKLIYMSASDVYSIRAKSPIDEEQILSPYSIYGRTKLFGEEICQEYRNVYPITIFRPSYIIGPGKTMGLTTIIKYILDGQRPILSTDSNKKIDIVHIDDVVQAIKLSFSKTGYNIYNVGSGTSRTLNEYVECVKKLADKTYIEPIYEVSTKKCIMDFELDITKIKTELGYKPKMDLEHTVEKTIREWQQWI